MASPTTSETPPPAPAFPGWRRNLLFIWIGVFTGLAGAQFVFPFMPFYIEELGVTDKGQIALYSGLTASATGLSLTLTAPLWGSLADRFGRKPMFIRALVGAGIVVLIMGAATSVWQVVALRFVMGAFAGTMGAAAALVAATTPREKVGYALGTLQTGLFTANMFGPVLGGIVAANLGLRQSFVFCSALFLTAATLVVFFVREPRNVPAPSASRAKSGGSIIGNLKVVISERQIVIMLGLLFILWLSTTFVRPVMPISVDEFADHIEGASSKADRVHIEGPGFTWDVREEAATGLVFGVVGLTSTIAALSVAPLGQRLGYKNCVTGAALLTGLLFFPVALASNFTLFMVFLGAVGLFQGAMVPGTNALIAASVPEGKHGSAFGLAASMQSMALLVGPLGGGFTSGLFGIEAVYLVVGVLLLAGALLAWFQVREPDLFVDARSPERAAG